MISRSYRWLEAARIRNDHQPFRGGWVEGPNGSMTQSASDAGSTEMAYEERETREASVAAFVISLSEPCLTCERMHASQQDLGGVDGPRDRMSSLSDC